MKKENINKLARCVKEAGIQYHKMEVHKWIKSQQLGYDIGVPGFVEWAKKHGDETRDWICDLPDCEINRIFEQLPERIKSKVYKKCKQN
ncbi:MAG TPA: hypothetical protein VKP78_08555 [bacterium]|nr:hypothetical protein [bacterium]